jgi:hypothetical protein
LKSVLAFLAFFCRFVGLRRLQVALPQQGLALPLLRCHAKRITLFSPRTPETQAQDEQTSSNNTGIRKRFDLRGGKCFSTRARHFRDVASARAAGRLAPSGRTQ